MWIGRLVTSSLGSRKALAREGRVAPKRRGPRDFQRARVYAWENRSVFPSDAHPLTVPECQALVELAYHWREGPLSLRAGWCPPRGHRRSRPTARLRFTRGDQAAALGAHPADRAPRMRARDGGPTSTAPSSSGVTSTFSSASPGSNGRRCWLHSPRPRSRSRPCRAVGPELKECAPTLRARKGLR